MLRFAQHDIDEVARIATQSLEGEDVKLHSLSKIYSCGAALEVAGRGGYDPSKGDLYAWADGHSTKRFGNLTPSGFYPPGKFSCSSDCTSFTKLPRHQPSTCCASRVWTSHSRNVRSRRSITSCPLTFEPGRFLIPKPRSYIRPSRETLSSLV